MDVLIEQQEYIVNTVPVKAILEGLDDFSVMSSRDHARILAIGDQSDGDIFQANKEMYQALLDCVAEYDDNNSCVFAVFDVIRERYPAVAMQIRAIQQGLRFQQALGPDVVLTVCNVNGALGYDIRKMRVSGISFRVFCCFSFCIVILCKKINYGYFMFGFSSTLRRAWHQRVRE